MRVLWIFKHFISFRTSILLADLQSRCKSDPLIVTSLISYRVVHVFCTAGLAGL